MASSALAFLSAARGRSIRGRRGFPGNYSMAKGASSCQLSAVSFWSIALRALPESHVDLEGLVVAQHLHLYLVARLVSAEGVGEVVEIRDRLAVEFREDVGALQSGLGRWGAFGDVRELDAFLRLREVRDAAEPGPVTIGSGA